MRRSLDLMADLQRRLAVWLKHTETYGDCKCYFWLAEKGGVGVGYVDHNRPTHAPLRPACTAGVIAQGAGDGEAEAGTLAVGLSLLDRLAQRCAIGPAAADEEVCVRAGFRRGVGDGERLQPREVCRCDANASCGCYLVSRRMLTGHGGQAHPLDPLAKRAGHPPDGFLHGPHPRAARRTFQRLPGSRLRFTEATGQFHGPYLPQRPLGDGVASAEVEGPGGQVRITEGGSGSDCPVDGAEMWPQMLPGKCTAFVFTGKRGINKDRDKLCGVGRHTHTVAG